MGINYQVSRHADIPVWKVCIARQISPARNFDAFYIK
jgi:hypothetical protein